MHPLSLSSDAQVSVVNADGSPAPQIPVRSGTGTSGVTQADGTVQLALNTPADASQLSVKVHMGPFGVRSSVGSGAGSDLGPYRSQALAIVKDRRPDEDGPVGLILYCPSHLRPTLRVRGQGPSWLT